MKIVSSRPLFIEEELNPAGIPFDLDATHAESLIRRGVAHRADSPGVIYEITSQQQNAEAFREQGVTCLCLTRNRRGWLEKAIRAYCAQSYALREMLIIADGEEVQQIIPDRPDIRLIHIEEAYTIGQKRNFGVQAARGKYVMHWDDDDYSAPDRVHDQVFRIQQAGKPVTGYSQIDFLDVTNGWWRYTGDENYAPGSSLLYERDWALQNPFRPIQVNEDGEFVRVAREAGMIATAESPGQLIATNHPGNTAIRIFNPRFWTPMSQSESGLTVIIPSRNMANARPCVEAVRELNPAARIVVVDDGLENPESLGVDVVPGVKPFIFSRNVNIGIQFAGRDDVIVLNDDALLKNAGGFLLLQRAHNDHPEFGIIGAVSDAVGNRNQRHRVASSGPMGLREDPRMVCFVAVLIPRATLDAVGYLDERFTAYGFEDDDYCYRVRRAGLKIGVHDDCFVDHTSLKSTFRGDPLTSAQLDGGRAIFEKKWGAYPL